MNPKPRILFVSHAASRNGATILLLNFLRWLRANSDFEIEVLMNGSGELVGEFQAVCKTIVWRNAASFFAAFPRLKNSPLRKRLELMALRWALGRRQYDLVYANTAAVWPQVALLREKSASLLWHIHELDYALRLSIGEQQMRALFPTADRFIVVSEAVRRVMANNFGVPEARMDVINGFAHFPEFTPASRLEHRRAVRQKLGWAQDAFVVGGCGGLGWRKGTDVFLQIAHELVGRRGAKDVRFLWIGGAGAGDEALRFDYEMRTFGLQDACKLIPTTADVLEYYQALDVFALTSREDPFPLVMLEAGVCHVPTVCFADAGGGPEYVGSDAGLVVPYLDIPEFVKQLEFLQKDHELRVKLGTAAAAKVRSQYTVEVQGAKMLATINKCLQRAIVAAS